MCATSWLARGAYEQGWGDQKGQTWSSVEQAIAASGRLKQVQVFEETPFWRDESVTGTISKELPPEPISADKVYVYELAP